MSEKKEKKIRQLTRYKVGLDPIRGKSGHKRKYAKQGTKRVDTGGGKSVLVGGNIVNIGVRALTKRISKAYKSMTKAQRRSYFCGQSEGVTKDMLR